jgi:hypothetical protein
LPGAGISGGLMHLFAGELRISARTHGRARTVSTGPERNLWTINQTLGDQIMWTVNRVIGAVCAIALGVAAAAANADVMVGGSAMFPQKNIIQNAINSKDHTTLVAAVKAAGLVETLEG